MCAALATGKKSRFCSAAAAAAAETLKLFPFRIHTFSAEVGCARGGRGDASPAARGEALSTFPHVHNNSFGAVIASAACCAKCFAARADRMYSELAIGADKCLGQCWIAIIRQVCALRAPSIAVGSEARSIARMNYIL